MPLSHALEPFGVNANRIVQRSDQAPILLRGVNRSGLEYCSPESPGSLVKAGITDEQIATIVLDWKANIIRIPFNQSWALAREGYNPDGYLSALDFVIERAAGYGAYTLLDLQWLDAVTPRGHLFNEPHDPLPDDPLATGVVTAAEWHPWARAMINVIRAVNPEALIRRHRRSDVAKQLLAKVGVQPEQTDGVSNTLSDMRQSLFCRFRDGRHSTLCTTSRGSIGTTSSTTYS